MSGRHVQAASVHWVQHIYLRSIFWGGVQKKRLCTALLEKGAVLIFLQVWIELVVSRLVGQLFLVGAWGTLMEQGAEAYQPRHVHV